MLFKVPHINVDRIQHEANMLQRQKGHELMQQHKHQNRTCPKTQCFPSFSTTALYAVSFINSHSCGGCLNSSRIDNMADKGKRNFAMITFRTFCVTCCCYFLVLLAYHVNSHPTASMFSKSSISYMCYELLSRFWLPWARDCCC